MTSDELKALEQIITTQRNVKIWGGIAIGMILVLYFFTFATLIDKAPFGVFIAQLVSAMVMVGLLIAGNRASLYIATRRHRGPTHRTVAAYLAPRDVLHDVEKTAQAIARRRAAQHR